MTSATAAENSSCIACLEPIRAGARICPHCGTSQRPQRWHNFSQILKWIGGIVTIVSLVGGVITLSRFYIDWKERHDAVDEIVAAADWLIRSENYNQAWDMYAQAAGLNPSSVQVRDGRFHLALVWIRDFQTDQRRVDDVLTQLTEILYRGLPQAEPNQSATILAHIGYVQVLRQVNQLPVFTDIEALFEQAFAASESNVYANAMYARWLTLARPMTVEHLDRAQQYFERALASGRERAYIRQLQFSAFTHYSYAHSDELELNSMTKLIRICIEMRANGEGYPDENTRYRIRVGYGNTGRADHVETLVGLLPPQAHLEVYEWLLQADDDSREFMQQQSTYIRARLNEEIGARDRALELYRQLLAVKTHRDIAALVDRGIERLTGSLPQRALARNYRNDAIDEANPFQFHLDTLEHFDPRWRSDNLEQALFYFDRQIEQNPAGLTALALALPTFIERVRDIVLEGNEIEKINAYSSGFSSSHHNNARQSWVDLSLLRARLLALGGQFDRALAQLGDVARALQQLGTRWQPVRALLDYRMAVLYAELSQGKDNSDREQSIMLLQRAIKSGLLDSKQASWQQIKSAPFDNLTGDPRYRELIRGR